MPFVYYLFYANVNGQDYYAAPMNEGKTYYRSGLVDSKAALEAKYGEKYVLVSEIRNDKVAIIKSADLSKENGTWKWLDKNAIVSLTANCFMNDFFSETAGGVLALYFEKLYDLHLPDVKELPSLPTGLDFLPSDRTKRTCNGGAW